nr:ComEC/Rec2 family competence protein [Palleronia pontilimi]
MALLSTTLSALRLDGQRGALVPWIPVCLACGIGAYFALPVEPSTRHWWILAIVLLLSVGGLLAGLRHWPLAVALILIVFGFGLAGLRTYMVAGPVLDWRYYGPVTGRVVTVDRSGSDKIRLTLDRVKLDRVAPEETPLRVRVSLHGQQDWLDPSPGQRIGVTAHLSQPQGPVEPGGFDFRRMAWFRGLGAVGYARSPAILVRDDDGTRPIGRLRMAISRHVRTVLPGEAGAFAAAITTGDRSAMGAETLAALRASNLAHLLAISGLHMGLLTGAAFWALRLAFSLVPGWALSRPVKKYAALGALAVGAVYLALSGGNVATQRAFIMAAVMLVAVCLDRRAVTLRAVAVSATIVLILRPEALTEPGFQMSFAATTALVAAFRMMRDHAPVGTGKWRRWLLALVFSSLVAGVATAPYGAAHFNQLSHYGLLANVLAVPVMGTFVMPAALLAACLAPLGLSWIGFWLMKPAVEWIMAVAHQVAALPNATSHVQSAPAGFLGLFSLGMLLLILWRGPMRFSGVAVAVAAIALWVNAERPAVLIAPSGGLIGVMQEGKRHLSKPKGDGFAARVWLENDGDLTEQSAAAVFEPGHRFWASGLSIVQISGRGAADRARESCAEGGLVVASVEVPDAAGSCLLLDSVDLTRTGAVSVRVRDGQAHLTSARAKTGARPWNSGPALPEALPTLSITPDKVLIDGQ